MLIATKSEKAKEYLIDADTFATDEEAKKELADEEARYLENLSSQKHQENNYLEELR